MPNTLAHLGIQAFATRTLVRDAEIKWIFLGCVVPDMAWIAGRILALFGQDRFKYDSMLYVTVQASLAGSLLLSACLATFSVKPLRVFAILASASLFHLLLDALQIKWGNGVMLFAPVSLSLLSFDLFWPEQWPTLAMSLFGMGYVIWAFLRVPPAPLGIVLPKGRTLILTCSLFGIYLVGPLALLDAADEADPMFISTVRHTEQRAGREALFDRGVLMPSAEGARLRVFGRIYLPVVGAQPNNRSLVSTKGHFIDDRSYEITEIHYHFGRSRDLLVYIGLLCVVAFWARDLGWHYVGWFRRRIEPVFRNVTR